MADFGIGEALAILAAVSTAATQAKGMLGGAPKAAAPKGAPTAAPAAELPVGDPTGGTLGKFQPKGATTGFLEKLQPTTGGGASNAALQDIMSGLG